MPSPFTAGKIIAGGERWLTVDVLKIGERKVAPSWGDWATVSLSPDGRRVVWNEMEEAAYPVWMNYFYLDSRGGPACAVTRLKFGSGGMPLWVTREQMTTP